MAGREWEEASFKRRIVEIQADSCWEDKSWKGDSEVVVWREYPKLHKCDSSQLCKSGWEVELVRGVLVYECGHKDLLKGSLQHIGKCAHPKAEDVSAVLRANHVVPSELKCLRSTRDPHAVPGQWLAGIRPWRNWCCHLRPKTGIQDPVSEELGGKTVPTQERVTFHVVYRALTEWDSDMLGENVVVGHICVNLTGCASTQILDSALSPSVSMLIF